MAAKKQTQKLTIGKWVADPDRLGESVFVKHETQPTDPITEMGDMLAWAKKEFGQIPGEYAFVREVPGAWVCGVQQVFDFAKKVGS